MLNGVADIYTGNKAAFNVNESYALCPSRKEIHNGEKCKNDEKIINVGFHKLSYSPLI